ncbi:MAG: hypothetical protein ACOX6T_21590 [Myxococcales bacterium]
MKFDLSWCWIVVDALGEIDLEDAVGIAEQVFEETVEHIDVSRLDGAVFGVRERQRLVRLVCDDLGYDRADRRRYLDIGEYSLYVSLEKFFGEA